MHKIYCLASGLSIVAYAVNLRQLSSPELYSAMNEKQPTAWKQLPFLEKDASS